MSFTSPIFLFGFLPLIILFFFIIPSKLKNLYLVVGSLFFYAWGEGEMVLILLLSVFLNYISGLLIHKYRNRGLSVIVFFTAVVLNILLLFAYKYTNFIADNINIILNYLHIKTLQVETISFPLGISFYTFQAISYLVDVYREEAEVETNPVDAALYMCFFPKIFSGPIIKYSEMKPQINTLYRFNSDNFYHGVSRFITGLAKKAIIADNLGIFAGQIFNNNIHDLSSSSAWLGILFYGLQLFFDFSGYTDMALGISKIFGYTLPENFNYPYIARNISDFWRRWHLSLSFWFRDYFYTPLSIILSRKWNPRFAIMFSVFVAFITIGLWHGPAWKFVIFGFIHAFFLVFEMLIGLKRMARIWRPIQHLYTLFIIMISTVFFRATDVSQAILFIKKLFIFDSGNIHPLPSNISITIFFIGIVFALPVRKILLRKTLPGIKKSIWSHEIAGLIYVCILCSLLFLSFVFISSQQYSPFIYFQF